MWLIPLPRCKAGTGEKQTLTQSAKCALKLAIALRCMSRYSSQLMLLREIKTRLSAFEFRLLVWFMETVVAHLTVAFAKNNSP